LSKIEVNTVEPQCGTTLTLGASGDTVTLGSGASQSGFGRTGTVDWQTGSIKTSTFTAANGEGYFANTTGGAFNLTLPSSPSAGNIVAVADYANNFSNNNLTIARNGSNIEGAASDLVVNQQGVSVSLVYVDATKGWVVVNAGNSSQAFGENFVVATGGCITTCGDCKIHTFTGPGTFTVSSVASTAANNVVSYAVVAGGGSGGTMGGGGGGAGGFREAKSPVTPYTASPLDGYPSSPNRVTVTATAFPITVGAGGTGTCAPSGCNEGVIGNPGNASTFSTVTSAGGGGGGARMQPGQTPTSRAGLTGGSGGGAARDSGPSNLGGAGNTPSTSPAQGQNGGASGSNSASAGGGGGGASAVGGNGSPNDSAGPGSCGAAGAGGAGVATSITGASVTRAGGGGGGSNNANGPLRGGGGPGGGGAGGQDGSDGGSCNPAVAGTTNTGGGGGGGSQKGCAPRASAKGGNGGSGIVIIRYKFQ